MQPYIDDEMLAKAAAAKGVTPLAETFGVKLADANAMLDQVHWEAFHEKLARHGHGARNEAQMRELEELGSLLWAKAAQEDEVSPNDGITKQAIETLRRDLGYAPEAASARLSQQQAAYDKVSQYVDDPEVAAHMVARFEAQNLVS